MGGLSFRNLSDRLRLANHGDDAISTLLADNFGNGFIPVGTKPICWGVHWTGL